MTSYNNKSPIRYPGGKTRACKILDKVISAKFPTETIIVDVTKPILIGDDYKFKVIINLAAEHRDDVEPKDLYQLVNVIGAKNIADYAKKINVTKIIFTSSVAVYGFADRGTGENGKIAPFNDYGRTKWEAEQVFSRWQANDVHKNSLVIIRPTVVFGEGNRGNVYSLLKQIARKRFLMVGGGENCKSLAYVENVASFIKFSIGFKPGIHLHNYIDKPDFSMRDLVNYAANTLGVNSRKSFYIPYSLGLLIGLIFDTFAKIQNKKYPISMIRIRKFCANSSYSSNIESTGFYPSISLNDALKKTIVYEFNC
jgi:nucleoside-diphosphate-sugar epimerase